jgi:hypothetical protein
VQNWFPSDAVCISKLAVDESTNDDEEVSNIGDLAVNKKSILVISLLVPCVMGNMEKPVIPDHLANAFLATVHLKNNHMKLIPMLTYLHSSYFVLKPKSRIIEIINRCITCNADEFIPQEIEEYSTTEPPDHSSEKLAGNVMKRNGSMVLVVTDNLTSHTSTALIK